MLLEIHYEKVLWYHLSVDCWSAPDSGFAKQQRRYDLPAGSWSGGLLSQKLFLLPGSPHLRFPKIPDPSPAPEIWQILCLSVRSGGKLLYLLSLQNADWPSFQSQFLYREGRIPGYPLYWLRSRHYYSKFCLLCTYLIPPKTSFKFWFYPSREWGESQKKVEKKGTQIWLFSDGCEIASAKNK